MHEFGLCEDVVAAVERRAAGRKVTGFTVRIGVMHRVDRPSFDSAFEIVRAGTLAAHATADVVVVPAIARCGDCGYEASTLDPLATCTACGSGDLSVSGGDELVLESITLSAAGDG